jgi:hypothetical protein
VLCRTVSVKDRRREKEKENFFFSDRRAFRGCPGGQECVSSPREIFSSRPSCFPCVCMSSSRRDLLSRRVFRGRPGAGHPGLNAPAAEVRESLFVM